jgi:hypothetical protein
MMSEQIHQQCLTTDLPRYIVEGPLPTRSGRIFRGYRVRSNNEQHHHGVLMVCKVALLKAQQQNHPSQPQSTPTTSSGGSSSSSSATTSANRASATSTSASTSSVFTSTSSNTTNSNTSTPINSNTTTTTTTINVSSLEEELKRHSQELHRIYSAVSNAETHPHILPYQRWIIPSYSSLSSSNISSNSNSSNNLSQHLTKKKIILNNPTSAATYTSPSTNAAIMASTLPIPIPSSSISSSTATPAASASSGVSNTFLQQQQQQPVYLLRQHCYTTLSDRLASRPFLSKVEKLWIIYQILCAIQSLHESNVCHGHLTTDNIMVTSWNWIILTDISSHIKPTFLPKDDPSIFIQYFQKSYQQQPTNSTAATNTTDTDLSKRCYIAPERFYNTRTPDTTRTSSVTALTPAMDIFSAVCYNKMLQ